MKDPIAVIGMSCRYPDANSPDQLWDNVLAGRRAFRRMPDERLRLDDYWNGDRAGGDTTYSTQAAVIEGYHFDRRRYRVSGSSFRTADMWSRRLLVALLRRYGISPYRYARQRRTTIMAKVSKRFIDETLWPEFSELSKVLHAYLLETTDRVIRQGICEDNSEPTVQQDLALGP